MSSIAAGSVGSTLPSMIMTNGKQPKLEPKAGASVGTKGMGTAGGSAGTSTGAAASGSTDKHESWQMELLMERLRGKAKSSQYKSFQDMSKSVRMSLLVIAFCWGFGFTLFNVDVFVGKTLCLRCCGEV